MFADNIAINITAWYREDILLLHIQCKQSDGNGILNRAFCRQYAIHWVNRFSIQSAPFSSHSTAGVLQLQLIENTCCDITDWSVDGLTTFMLYHTENNSSNFWTFRPTCTYMVYLFPSLNTVNAFLNCQHYAHFHIRQTVAWQPSTLCAN